MTRHYIVVDGRVQGVGFRYFCQMTAYNLNITGWIHNMSNGMVEMEIQGTGNTIQNFISLIKKGNYFIRITSLSQKEIEVIPGETAFTIK